ncbi:CBP80/20-dependent translation initiation factor [Grus japonensis]|uniref:CBP80/20-dependent translation initiation factor n=1 Tax=Grus japonensis TaxID=30415 RepID=A0ABC9Y915_GRUJA
MENSSVASASSEAGSSRSQEIEELERFIDSYVLEYQVQGLLTDKTEGDGESEKMQSHVSQWTANCSEQLDGSCSPSRGKGSSSHEHNQVHICIVLGTPELDAVPQVGSLGVEEENHLPRPAGHASFDATQAMVGFLGCKCTFIES